MLPRWNLKSDLSGNSLTPSKAISLDKKNYTIISLFSLRSNIRLKCLHFFRGVYSAQDSFFNLLPKMGKQYFQSSLIFHIFPPPPFSRVTSAEYTSLHFFKIHVLFIKKNLQSAAILAAAQSPPYFRLFWAALIWQKPKHWTVYYTSP